VLRNAVPLQTAMSAVVQRNGLDQAEAKLLGSCFKRALNAMAPTDRKACSLRFPRGARFLSVNANNHLVIRAPAWGDNRERYKEDIMLIWPQGLRPSIMTPSEYRRTALWRFTLIPCVCLYLTWDECLSLSRHDWALFRKACHDALTPRTRRWTSNVIL
jgi:hypothetical protein